MDILIHIEKKEFSDIIESLGFEIKKKRDYMDAIRWQGFRRLHIYYFSINKSTGCEIHSELFLHFLFLGVDYESIPLQFFETEIKPILAREIKWEILDGFTWFDRKNKALLRGFKLWEE